MLTIYDYRDSGGEGGVMKESQKGRQQLKEKRKKEIKSDIE